MKRYGMLAGLAVILWSSAAVGCTVFGVGRLASVDGSAMVSHTCDSRTDHFPLYIVPAADWPEGSERIIVKGAHGLPGEGQAVFKIPQARHTYRYLASRYSFLNEKGLAMSESTFWVDETDERSKKVARVMGRDAFGPMDAWAVMDVALERCSSARDAVALMGELVSKWGWGDSGETIPVTDGREVWIAEFYGNGMWAAWRLPDDQVFVAANRARLRHLDLTDRENVMAAPGMVEYAVKNGLIDGSAANEKDFSPADVFAPSTQIYSTRREWRALSLLAPKTFTGKPGDEVVPMSVVPDAKVTVDDIFRICGDWYEGTPYDLSKGPAAGPWGDPLRYANSSKEHPDAAWERSINMHRCTYIQICQVNAALPEALRGVAWFGYGAPDTTYLTPLWACMKELPPFYAGSSRYEPYSANSAWWVNIRLQHVAEMNYTEARKVIHAAREPKMKALYRLVPAVSAMAAELMNKGDVEDAVGLVSDFAYSNAVDWHGRWLALGDRLFSDYALGYDHVKNHPYPERWNEVVGFGELKR